MRKIPIIASGGFADGAGLVAALAAVFGVRHPHWVEAIVAVVVPRPGVSLDRQDIIKHCRSRLAGYKTPKYVVVVDSLPKNPSGKILKRELRNAEAQSKKRQFGRPSQCEFLALGRQEFAST